MMRRTKLLLSSFSFILPLSFGIADTAETLDSVKVNDFKNIDLFRYIDEHDRLKISEELARTDALKSFLSEDRLGTQFLDAPPTLENEENSTSTFTFEVEFSRNDTSSNSGNDTSSPKTSAEEMTAGRGNVECKNIQAHIPHIGRRLIGQNREDVVPKAKAKASGSCEYVHVDGSPPPYVLFELHQILLALNYDNASETRGVPETTTYSNVQPKRGLEAVWIQNTSSGGTQVLGECPPAGRADVFRHEVFIWIAPPPDWRYNGPRPFVRTYSTGNILSC